MSSSDAQRSGVHDSTEDSNAEPAGAMPGSGPVSQAPVGEAPSREAAVREGPGRDGREETRVKNDPDESSFGGPLDLDEPKGV